MKHYWLVLLGLLGAMALLQIASVRQDSQTWDEAIHLASGYSYLKTGDLRMNPEHPPFGKYVNALPLLFLNPVLPLGEPSWKSGDEIEFGKAFLFRNRIGADTLLFASRLMTVLISLALGLLIAAWTRRTFGDGIALCSLAFYAFDPNIIAHGRYVTSDLIEALFIFAACVTWYEYLCLGKSAWLVASGAAAGLAIASKFSGFILLPILVLLYFVHRVQGGKRHVISLLWVGLVAYVIFAIAYGPEARLLLFGFRTDPSLPPAQLGILSGSKLGNLLAHFSRLEVRRSHFVQGLGLLMIHNAGGHEAYLMGSRAQRGWWYYFPAVFGVKTATGVLLGLLAAAWIGARRVRTSWRKTPFAVIALVVPAVTYFLASLASEIDIGIRHLLPIYPFLFILIAAALWNHRIILAAAVVLTAVECIAAFPYYLAFFNLPSGGLSHGIHYLVDSNLDWGQDLRRLKAYLQLHGEPHVCLGYFGSALPEYYGIHGEGMPDNSTVSQKGLPDCLVAVSATPMMGMYVDDAWSWVRQFRPIADIGHSIYLFDFRAHGQR